MLTDERSIEVPRFYRNLHEPNTSYLFDNSPEAWLWKQMLDFRSETLIKAAGSIIDAYTQMGSYPPSGEDYYLLASLMSNAGWGDEEELEEFLAANRPKVERAAKEAQREREGTEE
jgi:hypothetical protein